MLTVNVKCRYNHGPSIIAEREKSSLLRNLARNASTYRDIQIFHVAKGLNAILGEVPGLEHDSRFPRYKDLPPMKDRYAPAAHFDTVVQLKVSD